MTPAKTTRGCRRLGTSLSLLLLASPCPALGAEGDQDQPVYLEADSVELDEANSVSHYKGSVFVKQGTMEMEADEMTVHHYPDRRPKRIIAFGKPAKYRQDVDGEKEKVEAEALRMEYEADVDEITLIDQALLYQGKDTFRSDRIVYDRTNERVKAGASVEGKERVKILINPSQR
jgi:lipopolysaccharide export system protein LptA